MHIIADERVESVHADRSPTASPVRTERAAPTPDAGREGA